MSADPRVPGSIGGARAAALADVVREAAEASLDPTAVLDVMVRRCTEILGGTSELRLLDGDEAAAASPAGAADDDRIAVPLRSRGRTLGTLTLARDPGAPPYTRDDARFAADLADRVALLYDNARLYRRVLLHATILDHVDAAVVGIDGHGRVSAWNPAAERLFGWSAREALGRDAQRLISAEPEERFAQARGQVLEVGTYAGEWSMRRRRGPPFTAHIRLAAARDEWGRAVGLVGVFEDLAERERLVGRLARHAEHLAAVAALGERALESEQPAELLAHAVETVRRTLGAEDVEVRRGDPGDPGDPGRGAAGGGPGLVEVPVHGRGGPQAVLAVRPGQAGPLGADDLAFLQSVANLLGDALDRWRVEEEIRRRSLHDPLTELPNRTLVLDRLAHALERAERRSGPPAGVALLFLDIDHFKVVNDSLGHRAGDELLREVANRLRNAVRPADTVGRFGGDEFVVLCEDVRDERMGLAIAERLAGVFARPFRIAGDEHQVGASIGLALRRGGEDPEALLRDADAAMYRAKERGRGRVELFDTGMRAHAAGRLQTEAGLRRAVDGEELEIHLQPIVDLGDRSVVAMEALVRWRHPERGLLAPGHFLAVAEESGLVVPLGRRVREQACAAAAAGGVRVHVNLSPRQLLDRALLETFEATLAATGAPPGSIAFELTESGLGERAPGRARQLERLRELGARLLLDRFGTGASSLGQLAHLPLDGIKIDRSLVAGIRGPQAPIVDAVIRLAGALGLEAVAVGIEEDEQLELLRGLGCRLGQGLLLGAPAPARST